MKNHKRPSCLIVFTVDDVAKYNQNYESCGKGNHVSFFKPWQCSGRTQKKWYFVQNDRREHVQKKHNCWREKMVSNFKISSCALPCSPNATGNNHSMGWFSIPILSNPNAWLFPKKIGANTILGWLDSFNILCSRPGLWIEALQKVCIHGAGYYALCQHFRTKNTFSANIAPAGKGKNNSNDHAMYINSWKVQGLSHAGEKNLVHAFLGLQTPCRARYHN